jgi:hypothetical protein
MCSFGVWANQDEKFVTGEYELTFKRTTNEALLKALRQAHPSMSQGFVIDLSTDKSPYQGLRSFVYALSQIDNEQIVTWTAYWGSRQQHDVVIIGIDCHPSVAVTLRLLTEG